MLKLDKKPSEEVYEIVLYGAFNPLKYHPLWFAENNLLGKKEASEAEIIAILKEDAVFETKFLRIHVEKETFKIRTEQRLSWDLVREMAVNVAKILGQSLNNVYSVHVKLHYTFKSKSEFSKVLNSFNKNGDVWSDVLKKPQLTRLSVEESHKTKIGQVSKMVNLFPCNREDMKNTIHVYVSNVLSLNTKYKKPLSSIIENDEQMLNDAVTIVNKLINAYL